MMNKEFVLYEEALALKELGFNEKCLGWYLPEIADKGNITSVVLASFISNWNHHGDRINAPLYQQAFKFFREKYNLFGCIDLQVCTPSHWYIRVDNIIKNDYLYHSEDENLKFKTYEEAELACLKKLIEITKK
jgi:hypothetical protein